jgi:apurinic endonuclease APN1
MSDSEHDSECDHDIVDNIIDVNKLQKEKPVINMDWIVGSHVGWTGTFLPSVQKADGVLKAIQLFYGNPIKAYERAQHNLQDLKNARDYVRMSGCHVISHFPYAANFAGSVKELAWTEKSDDSKMLKLLESLSYELSVLARLKTDTNVSGVVIHPGSFKKNKEGLDAVVTSINNVDFKKKSKLILENSAGSGTTLCSTFEEISYILKNIKDDKKPHVGVCIDTAHIHGVGKYNLSKVEDVQRMFDDFDTIIGAENLCIVHLNDSKVKLGSRVDRHAEIGTGYIWGNSVDSLVYLLNELKRRNVPAILETCVSDIYTIQKIWDMRMRA